MTKRNRIIYWVATLWLALGMVSTGTVQVFNVKEGAGGIDSITHLGYPVYFATLLGICKIMGTIIILIPKFSIVKEWAYAGFFFTMLGAIASHIVVGDAVSELFPALLLLVLTIISWYFRPESRKAFLMIKNNSLPK